MCRNNSNKHHSTIKIEFLSAYFQFISPQLIRGIQSMYVIDCCHNYRFDKFSCRRSFCCCCCSIVIFHWGRHSPPSFYGHEKRRDGERRGGRLTGGERVEVRMEVERQGGGGVCMDFIEKGGRWGRLKGDNRRNTGG